jgi:glycosyltransferase involved in cell wall biosynthesis
MTETKFKIYSLLVVKNEVDVIVASLKDSCRWSDKIIVIDNGSTDGTWEKIQELALSIPQIIPWLRYEGAFHIGLRAKAFYAFRQEMTSNDWWNVRLDADEFYPGDVRAFLAQVPSRYRTIKKESTDYILTHEDIPKILSLEILNKTNLSSHTNYLSAAKSVVLCATQLH